MLIGAGAIVGLKTESTYGVDAASDRWLPVTSVGINAARKVESPGHLFPAAGAVTHAVQRDKVLTGVSVGGPLEFVPHYDHPSTLVMLRHMFGAAPVTAGAGPYTHTYTMGGDYAGLTLQVIEGTVRSPLANNVRRVTGACVASWELTLAARSVAKVKCQIIAQQIGAPTTVTGTPAVTDSEEILSAHASALGTLAWSGVYLRATDVTVKCDHKLEETPFVGSLYTAQPARGDFQEVMLTAKVYVTGDDPLVDYAALDRGDLVLTLTGDTGDNAGVITLEEAVITKCDRNVDSAGIVFYQVEWVGSAAAGKTGLKWVMTNSLTTWE